MFKKLPPIATGRTHEGLTEIKTRQMHGNEGSYPRFQAVKSRSVSLLGDMRAQLFQSCNGSPTPEVDLPEVMVCSTSDENASLPLEVWLQLNPTAAAVFLP